MSNFRATSIGCDPRGGSRSRVAGDGSVEPWSFGGVHVITRIICAGSAGRLSMTSISCGLGHAATRSLYRSLCGSGAGGVLSKGAEDKSSSDINTGVAELAFRN
jgi:hypothetical protein